MKLENKKNERRIFQKQLDLLREKNYIGANEYEHVRTGFNRFCENEDQVINKSQSQAQIASQPIIQTPEELNQRQNQDLDFAEKMRLYQMKMRESKLQQIKPKEVIKQQIPVEKEQTPISNEKVQIPIPKEKAPISKEKVRERNITWFLNIGVIMVLTSGLTLATSNWTNMSDWFKVTLIGLVSVFFYGLAFLSIRYLKINRTGFAFVVLGSLFLPIFILSIGWYQLLGQYLSVTGEGKYFLGFLGSLVILPIYGWFAAKLDSRLFVWLTLISSSTAAGFLIRALVISTDMFYLGMIIFNMILLFGLTEAKKKDWLPIYSKELLAFSQVQLLITTLLLLLFFENPVFYGFNLMLAASVYLAMIYVSGKKEYHFVFTIMLVYGTYQFFEKGIFNFLSPIGFALLGFVFLIVPKLFENNRYLHKAFHITSAVISGLAFLYISLEALLLRMGEPSVILLIAYLLIACNFVYLANQTQNRLFKYLGPVFIASAFYELNRMMDSWIEYENHLFPVFFIGLALFTLFGWVLRLNWLQVIQPSSRDIGFIMMLGSMYVSVPLEYWWELGIMLFIVGAVSYLLPSFETRKLYLELAPWAMPLFLGLGIISFSGELYQLELAINDILTLSSSFIFAGIVLVGLSRILKGSKVGPFIEGTFRTAHGFNIFGLLLSHFLFPENEWGQVMIWIFGTIMLFVFYKKIRGSILPYPIALAILYVYYYLLIVLNAFDLPDFARSFIPEMGGVILLLIGQVFNKADKNLSRGFYYIGHIYFAMSVLFTLIIFWEQALVPMILALIIYMISFRFATNEWIKKVFLYGSFTSLFFTVLAIMGHYLEIMDLYPYAFLFTSIIIGVFWLLCNMENKNRTVFYLIPISLIGIYSFVFYYDFTSIMYFISIVYSIGAIWLTHYYKWTSLAVIPLLLTVVGVQQLIEVSSWSGLVSMLVLISHGLVLLFTGKLMFEKLWKQTNPFDIRSIDVFSIVSFLFFGLAYEYAIGANWETVIPGLCISLGLFLQRNRLVSSAKPYIVFASGIYLLQPYYAWLIQLDVPTLWERELILLPWVGVVEFLRIFLKEKHSSLLGYLHWGVLGVVSLILVIDSANSPNISEALILGSLALVSLIAGMGARMKSYFFIGSGVLLLNLVVETRQFWGNLPWYVYLLAGGSILIIIASLNEWNKQKINNGQKSLLVRMKDTLLEKLSHWK